MAKLSRVLQKVFGSSGGSSEFGEIGSLAAGAAVYSKDLDTIQSLSQFLEGLFALTASGAEPPRIQDLNSLYLLITSQLKYIFQAGVPEYIATEEYYIGSICQVAGVVYVSQSGTNGTPNTGNDPATDDGTNWLELLDADGILAKLLTVDGAGSDLDADKVHATTPGTGGLALLALAALGADWATALESAANTAVKNNDSDTVDGVHANNMLWQGLSGVAGTAGTYTATSLTANNILVIPAGLYNISFTEGFPSGGYGALVIKDAQSTPAWQGNGQVGGLVLSDGVNFGVCALDGPITVHLRKIL